MQPIKFHRIHLHIGSVVLLSLSLFFDFWQNLLVLYAVVIVHELTHIMVAEFCGIHTQKMDILPFGVCATFKTVNMDSTKAEILIAMSGPISNLLMLAVAIHYNLNSFFALANLSVLMVNLLPILPLDGGRILKSFLVSKFGYQNGFNISILITKILAVLLTLVGAILLWYTKFNFSLLLISCFLYANILSEVRGSKILIMKELAKSCDKLSNKGVKYGGIVNAMYYTPARNILKELSYNKYYTVFVLDVNMKIIGKISETELINTILTNGINVTCGDIV